MAVYRIRRFSAPVDQNNSMSGQLQEENAVTSRDIRLENMRLRRELMRNQRQEQRLKEQERRQNLQAEQEAQRRENQRDTEETKNQIKTRESQRAALNPGTQNTGLYKKATTAVKPISMN